MSSYDLYYVGSVELTAATFLSGISWGIMTSMYSITMYNLVYSLRSAKATRTTALLAAWITLSWISSSLSTMANAYCTIYAYSWEMDYPGGPLAWLVATWTHPAIKLAYSTFILTGWFADAMMLWRVAIFCQGVGPLVRTFVLSSACLICVGQVGTSCFTIVIIGSQTLFSKAAMKATIPAFTLFVMLSIFSTAFISIRLHAFKKLMERTLGREEAHTSPYTSIVTMLIESSALHAVWSLAFIITYAVNSPGQFVLLSTLCNVQVVSVILIVYRVSKGVGWEQTTSVNLIGTHLSFARATANLDMIDD